MPDVPGETASFPLIRALLERRSRRFATGLRLNGGPLAFESRRPPAPLSVAEEATLAFAATGVTGHALSELRELLPSRRSGLGATHARADLALTASPRRLCRGEAPLRGLYFPNI
jgi:hypothetical protein